jgi:phosphohistidine phosphatase
MSSTGASRDRNPMFLILVHHADAVTGIVDATRPLSELGHRQAESVSARVAAHGIKPAAVWHSGKLRARETAEIYWRAVNPAATFVAQRGLQPDDDPEALADVLNAETDDLMVVSHYPLLPGLLRELTGGDVAFPQHGAVGLEHVDGRWIERWRETPATSDERRVTS